LAIGIAAIVASCLAVVSIVFHHQHSQNQIDQMRAMPADLPVRDAPPPRSAAFSTKFWFHF
jgi:hypothetical protein